MDDDMIYRQAAIDAVIKHLQLDYEYSWGVREAINALPAAESERKTGKWEIIETAYEDVEAKCSCCGFETLVNQPGNGLHMVNDLHFCPNCGADMRGDDNG